MADTIETYPIVDAFATKLASVEVIGTANVRLTFAVADRASHPGERPLDIVVAKIVVELAALPQIMAALSRVDKGDGLSSATHEFGPVH